MFDEMPQQKPSKRERQNEMPKNERTEKAPLVFRRVISHQT